MAVGTKHTEKHTGKHGGVAEWRSGGVAEWRTPIRQGRVVMMGEESWKILRLQGISFVTESFQKWREGFEDGFQVLFVVFPAVLGTTVDLLGHGIGGG
jgi:hypothetical protein